MNEIIRVDELLERPAVFSACRQYRYSLMREVDWNGPPIAFVMLNPSTADETQLDPTVRRCYGFAQRERCSRLYVLNLFALRSTDPRALYASDDPIDHPMARADLNGGLIRTTDAVISAVCTHVAARGGLIVCAWGNHGALLDRGTWMRSFLRVGDNESILESSIHHFGLTKTGEPKHPLYLRRDQELMPWL